MEECETISCDFFTMEVEFVAYVMRHLIIEYNCKILSELYIDHKLFYDNNSTVLYFNNNNRSSMKLKYIDIKFLVVKERIQNGQLFIKNIGINFIIVDPFIKGVSSMNTLLI